MRGKAKVGLLKATSTGPALLPGGDGDAQEKLCSALQQGQQECLWNRMQGAG